jgi:thiamine biosynthesis protein ThiS
VVGAQRVDGDEDDVGLNPARRGIIRGVPARGQHGRGDRQRGGAKDPRNPPAPLTLQNPDYTLRSMTIILNGEPFVVHEGGSIEALLARLEIDPRRVAVERNLAVVKRQAYASTVLEDGDQIEVVNFVGGG